MNKCQPFFPPISLVAFGGDHHFGAGGQQNPLQEIQHFLSRDDEETTKKLFPSMIPLQLMLVLN